MAYLAFHRRLGFGLKGSVLFMAVSAMILSAGGCDSESGKADKSLREQLDAASVAMNGSDADRARANSDLSTAARDTDASPAQQLRAKALLADSELDLAKGIDLSIQANDAKMDQLAREIVLLSNELETNNLNDSALAKYDPAPLQQAVDQKKADIAGSDAKPEWFKSDSTTLFSSSALDAQAKDLDTKIAELTAKLKTESDQRNQLLDQADKLTQQSQHVEKDKSVDLYTQGSGARKQAADLTVQIDQDTAALASLQADRGVIKSEQDAAVAAASALDAKKAALGEDWASIQAQQAALAESSKKILGDDPVNVPVPDKTGDLKTDETIGSKLAALVELAKKNHDLRASAATHFKNAADKYGEAASLATKLRQDLTDQAGKVSADRPDQEAWKQQEDALDSSTYRLLQADAQLLEAEFYARSAAEAKVRLDLIADVKPVLTEAKLTVPPKLSDPETDQALADQLDKSQSSARDLFKDCTDLLGNIADGRAEPEAKSGAQVQAIFAQYGWYALELAADKPQDAANHLTFAKNAVEAAVAAGDVLPQLPPELMKAAMPAGAGGVAAPTPSRGTALPPQ